jgi:leader peptidase (prepilin peptidase) / N-methyltransferase
MDMIWIAAGAIAGLPAGTVLRGQVARLSVPSGEPDEASCRECAAPLPGRPALRCGHCAAWIGAPLAIESIAATVLALLFARLGTQPAAAAFAFVGVLGVALTQIDVAVRRLPDRLTLPAYPATAALLAIAAALQDAWPAFLRALLAGLALGAAFLVLGLVSSGQLGGGDIKLAGLIGMVLGWLGWRTLITGACLGFVLAAIVSLVMLASRKVSWRSMISFGPYMLAGALLAVLGHGP